MRRLLYKYWLHESVTWDIVTLKKTMVTEAKPRLTLVFKGWQFPMLPSLAVNNYYTILSVSLHVIFYKYIVYIMIGFKTIQVKFIRRQSVFGEYPHKFCAVDIFWNIIRRQALSPVAKSHHVLGRGCMIQLVILIFINSCLSANQNQLFYMTVWYH